MVVDKATILGGLARCVGVDVSVLTELEELGVARIGTINDCYYVVLKKLGVRDAIVVLSCEGSCRLIGDCPKPLFCYAESACKSLIANKVFTAEDLVLGLPVRLTVLNERLFAFLLDGSYSPYTSYRLMLDSRLVGIVGNFDYVCGVVFGWEEPYTLWVQPGYNMVYGFVMLSAVSNGRYFTTYELRKMGYGDLLPRLLLENVDIDSLEKLLHSVLAGARLGVRLVNEYNAIIFTSKSLVQGLARWNNLLDHSLLNVVLGYYARACLDARKSIERERIACELGQLLLHSLLEEMQARKGLVVELRVPHNLKDDVIAEFSKTPGFRVKGITTNGKTAIVKIERHHPLLEPLQKGWHSLSLPF